jgi:hypothetical protein
MTTLSTRPAEVATSAQLTDEAVGAALLQSRTDAIIVADLRGAILCGTPERNNCSATGPLMPWGKAWTSSS